MSSYATKFRFYNLHGLKDMEEDLKEDWVQVPQSKNSFGGVFEVGSASTTQLQHNCNCDVHFILFLFVGNF